MGEAVSKALQLFQITQKRSPDNNRVAEVTSKLIVGGIQSLGCISSPLLITGQFYGDATDDKASYLYLGSEQARDDFRDAGSTHFPYAFPGYKCKKQIFDAVKHLNFFHPKPSGEECKNPERCADKAYLLEDL